MHYNCDMENMVMKIFCIAVMIMFTVIIFFFNQVTELQNRVDSLIEQLEQMTLAVDVQYGP